MSVEKPPPNDRIALIRLSGSGRFNSWPSPDRFRPGLPILRPLQPKPSAYETF
jgi:hypothetical protein